MSLVWTRLKRTHDRWEMTSVKSECSHQDIHHSSFSSAQQRLRKIFVRWLEVKLHGRPRKVHCDSGKEQNYLRIRIRLKHRIHAFEVSELLATIFFSSKYVTLKHVRKPNSFPIESYGSRKLVAVIYHVTQRFHGKYLAWRVCLPVRHVHRGWHVLLRFNLN